MVGAHIFLIAAICANAGADGLSGIPACIAAAMYEAQNLNDGMSACGDPDKASSDLKLVCSTHVEVGLLVFAEECNGKGTPVTFIHEQKNRTATGAQLVTITKAIATTTITQDASPESLSTILVPVSTETVAVNPPVNGISRVTPVTVFPTAQIVGGSMENGTTTTTTTEATKTPGSDTTSTAPTSTGQDAQGSGLVVGPGQPTPQQPSKPTMATVSSALAIMASAKTGPVAIVMGAAFAAWW